MTWPDEPRYWYSWFSILSIINQKLNYIKAQLDSLGSGGLSSQERAALNAVEAAAIAVKNEAASISTKPPQ